MTPWDKKQQPLEDWLDEAQSDFGSNAAEAVAPPVDGSRDLPGEKFEWRDVAPGKDPSIPSAVGPSAAGPQAPEPSPSPRRGAPAAPASAM